MSEEDERPKVSKAEEKESFLKGLDERLAKINQANEEYAKLVERNEEVAARRLLGGKTDTVEQSNTVKQETPKEYAERIERGQLKPGEFLPF